MTMRILIVEDEEIQRRVLTLGLAAEGFDVESASCAPAAIALAESGAFDVALVDLMLAGANGLEVARAIRTSRPATAIVLMSAYHLSEEQIAKMNIGAIGFIPKPYRIQEIGRFLRAKLEHVPAAAVAPTG